jgi:hypothetical protein
MRNKNRFIFWSLVGVLLIWAFNLLGCFSSFSQTSRQANVSENSNGSVLSNNSGVSSTSVQTNTIETSGNIVVNKKVMGEKRCSSGFSKIPSELQETYLKQVNVMKESNDTRENDLPLKNDVDFYGFTYPFENSFESKNNEIECGNKPTDLKQIHFVAPQVNNLIKKYMSTIIFNETETIASKRKLIENSTTVNKIKLCQDIECGTQDPKVSRKSFDFLTLGDIEYARNFSDTIVGVNALNEIRQISQSNNQAKYITDSEINQLLTAARQIVTIKLKEY